MKLSELFNIQNLTNPAKLRNLAKQINYKYVAILAVIYLIVLIFLYTRPRYTPYLPTLPFLYDNNEAEVVLKETQSRTSKDERFFKLTDPSIVYAFTEHVKESAKTLESIITRPIIMAFLFSLKYSINRPRPYQLNKEIEPLHSKTGNTPSLPAGHAFQAYYLAKVLSRKYPEKKALFNSIAKRCDTVRVKAGIHYPSDGAVSKKIVDILTKIKLL